MPNISLTAINKGDTCYASVVNDNFAEIESQVTQLDSVNYADSSVLSRHVGVNAIRSQHLSDSAIAAGKISSQTVVYEQKMNYASADGGVRALRLATSAPPQNGVVFARQTISTNVASHTEGSYNWTFSVAWSNCEDGDPQFTAAPIVNMPLFYCSQTTNTRVFHLNGPSQGACILTANNSTGATFAVEDISSLAATDTYDATWHIGAYGAKSG